MALGCFLSDSVKPMYVHMLTRDSCACVSRPSVFCYSLVGGGTGARSRDEGYGGLGELGHGRRRGSGVGRGDGESSDGSADGA